MKLKHLFAMALMAVGGSAWAEDVWKDVTSTYLTNADLEGEYTSKRTKQSGDNQRKLYEPNGWTLTQSSCHDNDATLLELNDPNTGQSVRAKFASVTYSEGGDKTYRIRTINKVDNRKFELAQEKTLLKGHYKLSANYYQTNNNAWGTIFAGNSTKAGTSSTSWNPISTTFTSDGLTAIKLGIRHTSNNNSEGIVAFDNFKLEYNLTKTLADKIAEANSAKIAGDASKYITALETAITTAEDNKESQDATELEQAITDLSYAIEAYTAKATIINSLINVRKEIARAEAYSVVKTDNATAYATAIQAAKNAIDEDTDVDYSSVILAMQNFKVEDYNYVTTTYTEVLKNSFDWSNTYRPTWTTGNDSWTGTSASYNNDYENDMNRKGTMELHLAKGSYAFVAAGRAASSASAYIKVGDTQTYFTSKNNKGLGVDKDGKANFNPSGTYANNNEGFGWEWRFITFDVTEDEGKDVTLEIGYSGTGMTWASISAPVLYMTSETKAAIDLADARKSLKDAIEAAPAKGWNVGTAAFQISVADGQTYSDAIDAAQTEYDNNAATVESLNTAKETLLAAINTFKNSTLNAPADGQKFNFVLGKGNSYSGKAITYIACGRNDQGNYGVSYEQEPNAIYAQAFTMTQVEGNKYKMSQTDANGDERYLCTAQGGYSTGSDYQIRTTTDAEKALIVEVVPTDAEGVYNLKNTAANANIGSKDNGVYTNDGNGTYVVDFTITEAQKATANLKVKDGVNYATFIAPFDVDIPNGVEAYSATVQSTYVELVQLPDEQVIPANTPCILQSTSAVDENVEGWGLAIADSYTVDPLTGVYKETAIEANASKYVLQNGAFYLVNVEGGKVSANRCYLTAQSDARTLSFQGDETAIDALDALTSGKAQIFDLNGRKLNKLQKGINIVNGTKIIVK